MKKMDVVFVKKINDETDHYFLIYEDGISVRRNPMTTKESFEFWMNALKFDESKNPNNDPVKTWTQIAEIINEKHEEARKVKKNLARKIVKITKMKRNYRIKLARKIVKISKMKKDFDSQLVCKANVERWGKYWCRQCKKAQEKASFWEEKYHSKN
jgi:hypothetical protein